LVNSFSLSTAVRNRPGRTHSKGFILVSRAGLGTIKGIDNIQVIDVLNRSKRWSRSKLTFCHHCDTTLAHAAPTMRTITK